VLHHSQTQYKDICSQRQDIQTLLGLVTKAAPHRCAADDLHIRPLISRTFPFCCSDFAFLFAGKLHIELNIAAASLPEKIECILLYRYQTPASLPKHYFYQDEKPRRIPGIRQRLVCCNGNR
jgi:hypothetical protein